MKTIRSIPRSVASIALLLALVPSITSPAHAAGDTDTWAHIDTDNASQGTVSVTVDAVPSGYAVVSLFWKEDGKWTGAQRIHRINCPHLCSCTDGGFFFDEHGVVPCRNMLILRIKKIHNTTN